MKRLTIIGLWPDDVVKYCTEKCDCRRYAFDRILYHRGGRDARERICIPVVDRSGAVTTYLDLPVLFLEANAVYLHLDDGSDIFLSNTQTLLIANEVERLARLKQNSMNNYKQYLEWEKEDRDLALDRLRRCVQDALKEDLRVTDTDERKGMFSTPGRGPSVYETAAVYSEIFRRARAGRAVAPLAVYSAAKYDETMTAARKRASVMLGL